MVGGPDGIAPAAFWRLAFIFDAPRADRPALRAALTAAKGALRAAANGAGVRIGIAEHFMDSRAGDPQDYNAWRKNDGAVEITVPAERARDLPSMAGLMRPILEPLVDVASVEVLAGPTYFMVPPRIGTTVLSLSFRRDPRITKDAFSRWWFFQHSALAIPLLGKQLLGYDQVHCDHDMSKAAAAEFGVPASAYDAYDNLTWSDWDSFLQSTGSDPTLGRQLAEDEEGRIDNSTRRHGIMAVLE